MASSQRGKRVITRDRQSAPRRTRGNVPDDEVSSDDESSTTTSSSSDGSSLYDGMSSDEEPTGTRSLDDSASGGEEQVHEELEEVSTDGEVSAYSGMFGTKPSTKDPLTRLLASDQTLTRMNINHRYLKEWSSALPIEDIMLEIAKQPSLKTLCFDMENVTMTKYDVILECIGHSESLEKLILLNTRVNRHTANVIATALFDNPDSLKELVLKKCPFAGSGFAIMFLGVQHVPGLTHLSVEDCSLQGFASEIISATIPFLKSLTSLRLVKTQLPAEGLRYLFDNMVRSAALVELDLSKNDFDTQSISWLVGCLQSSKTKIERLTLNKCNLDGACIDILTRALVDDKTLVDLSLSFNSIGDAGGISLVTMLKSNHQLQKLSLKACQISRKILKQLHNCIRYNNSFLKNMFSSELSLAILDSFSMVETVPETMG